MENYCFCCDGLVSVFDNSSVDKNLKLIITAVIINNQTDCTVNHKRHHNTATVVDFDNHSFDNCAIILRMVVITLAVHYCILNTDRNRSIEARSWYFNCRRIITLTKFVQGTAPSLRL